MPIMSTNLVVPKTVDTPLPWDEAQLRAILKKHDINGDGRLSNAELKKVFQTLGSWIPDWRVRRALLHSDANKDGFVDSGEEFNDLVNYVIRLGYRIN